MTEQTVFFARSVIDFDVALREPATAFVQTAQFLSSDWEWAQWSVDQNYLQASGYLA